MQKIKKGRQKKIEKKIQQQKRYSRHAVADIAIASPLSIFHAMHLKFKRASSLNKWLAALRLPLSDILRWPPGALCFCEVLSLSSCAWLAGMRRKGCAWQKQLICTLATTAATTTAKAEAVKALTTPAGMLAVVSLCTDLTQTTSHRVSSIRIATPLANYPHLWRTFLRVVLLHTIYMDDRYFLLFFCQFKKNRHSYNSFVVYKRRNERA